MKKILFLSICLTSLFADNLFYNEISNKWIGVESIPCTKKTTLKIDARKVAKFDKGDYFLNEQKQCFEITNILNNDRLIEYYDKSWSIGYFENGVVMGWFRTFFADNTLKSEIFFNNGVKQGKSREFYKGGILKLEEMYLNNLLNGQRAEYEFNGRPIKVNIYKDNKKHGFERVYNVQGRPTKQFEYNNNTILPQYKTYHYDDGGHLSHVAHYENNKKNGSWQYYNKQGNLIKEVVYENDKQAKVINHLVE